MEPGGCRLGGGREWGVGSGQSGEEREGTQMLRGLGGTGGEAKATFGDRHPVFVGRVKRENGESAVVGRALMMLCESAMMPADIMPLEAYA